MTSSSLAFVAASILLSASAHAQTPTPPKLQSYYLDVAKCVPLVEDMAEEGYSKQECPSVGGIRIFSESGDDRQWLSFQRPQDKDATAIAELGVLTSSFLSMTNNTIEVRYKIANDGMIPVGAIYRVSGQDITSDQTPSPTTQTLIVVSFQGATITDIADIDAKQADANEQARKALDAIAK